MNLSDHPSGTRPIVAEAIRVAVPLSGLGPGGCGAETVERTLRKVRGVLDVYVNRANEVAYITYDPEHVDGARLRRTLEVAGFRPGSPEAWLRL